MLLLPTRGRSTAAGLLAVLLCAVTVFGSRSYAEHRRGKHTLSPEDTAKYAALDAHTYMLPVLDAASMSAADRASLQQREAEVSTAAAFYGFDISNGHWAYRQIVCHTLPDHLMLTFDNDSVEHGPSHFVAVLPRAGGKVQIVTAYAHGLLPFHAAWEKSTAYQTFNRMTQTDRGEHSLGPESHWLNLGMCFAALTGYMPRVAEPTLDVDASEALVKRRGSTPVILIDKPGTAEVDFSDVAEPQQTGNWRLHFDARGRLNKADLDAVKPMQTRVVPMSPIIPAIRPE